MLASSCALIALALCPAPDDRKPSLTGDIRRHEAFESRLLGTKRDVWVYLPARYERDAAARYPVLYMGDGQNVFDGSTSYLPNEEWGADETAQGMIAAGLCEPVIIVAIAHGGVDRDKEYLPTVAKAGKSGGEMGGRADVFGKFLIEELKPIIDKEYRTRPGREDTGICGASFGGIMSLHLGLSRSEVFGRVAAVSPSLWWDGELMTKRVQELASKPASRFWVDMGTNESVGAIDSSRKFAKAMRGKGWAEGKEFVYYEAPLAAHNEKAWRERFGLILAWLYPPVKS